MSELDLFGQPLPEEKVESTNAKPVPTAPNKSSTQQISYLKVRPCIIIKDTPTSCWLMNTD